MNKIKEKLIHRCAKMHFSIDAPITALAGCGRTNKGIMAPEIHATRGISKSSRGTSKFMRKN